MSTQPPDDGSRGDPAPKGPTIDGRYEVSTLLGRGGMAEVREGHDLRLGRTVAIKRLRSDLAIDPMFQARFRREAQSAASLNHPAIVSVYDTGEETNASGVSIPYIVMEYVEGKTLREILREGRKLLPERALEIVTGVLSALDYSHRAGIVHRDIKPANVMLTPIGEIKVMDFGIARAIADASASMTQTAAVVGTAQYLSPEQARGEQVDARSDIYSTGCLLFELLTGRPPFVGDSPVAVAYQHVREEPLSPSSFDPEISPEIDAITAKALAKRVDERYQSAAEMRADIERALAGQQVSAPAVAGPEPTQALLPPLPMSDPAATGRLPVTSEAEEAPRRRTWVYVLLALAILLVLVAFAVLGKELFPQSTATQVSVPGVVDSPRASAVAKIENVNLVPQVTVQNSDSIDKGVVMSQDPGVGTLVDSGSTVDLVVSAGTAKTEVPPGIEDMTLSEAEAALESANLKADPQEVTDSSETKGQVTSTDPGPGTNLPVGSTVTVFYSAGLVTMPSVIGLTEDEATTRLEALNLIVAYSRDPTSSESAGTVIAQDPAEGTKLASGERVVVTVSSKPDVTPTTPTTPTPPSTETPTTPTPPSTQPPGSPSTSTPGGRASPSGTGAAQAHVQRGRGASGILR
jgi:serine/threonine-protein kinase